MPSALGALVFSVLALTSHFGTFVFDVVLWPALLAAIFWVATPHCTPRQRTLLWVIVSSGLALAVVYYAGYWELFTSQWGRMMSRDYATGEALVTGPLSKLRFNWVFFREQLGIVFILLVFLGSVPILRRPGASLFHAAAAAWTGVTVLFFALDLMTALEVRYVLQATPIFSLFAAAYVSAAFQRGKVGKLAAVAALVYLIAVGLVNIHDCLLFRYH
jgi:hypothetical protein